MKMDGELAYRSYIQAVGASNGRYDYQTAFIRGCWAKVEKAIARKVIEELRKQAASKKTRKPRMKYDSATNQWYEDGMARPQ